MVRKESQATLLSMFNKLPTPTGSENTKKKSSTNSAGSSHGTEAAGGSLKTEINNRAGSYGSNGAVSNGFNGTKSNGSNEEVSNGSNGAESKGGLVKIAEPDDQKMDMEPKSKRAKQENDEESGEPKSKKKKDNSSAGGDKPLKCVACRQLLNSETLKMFNGDSPEAVDEFIALASECLSLFDAESTGDEWNDRPQHRLTDFSVYDEQGHLCPFDTGLIEKNVHLYFSGYIKPIYDDTPVLEGGVLAKKLGPIDAWYIAGFDGGEKELIGFTTIYADYLLTSCSDQYAHIYNLLREKTFLSKTVIEYLESDPECSLEDLINYIQTVVPPDTCTKFNEDTLLRHAQFLTEQIESYDRAADDDESLLIVVPCVRDLIKLAGVTLGKRRAQRRSVKPSKGKESKTKPSDISMATVTPLVQCSFESIFVDQMSGTEKGVSRAKRCNVCEACQSPDCGECSCCKDMIKFGGGGKSKQACKNRKCPNMAIQDAEDNEDIEEKQVKVQAPQGKHVKNKASVDGKFVGEPYFEQGKKAWYSTAEVEGYSITVGDFVTISPATPTEPLYIARVMNMWRKGDQNYIHALWLSRPGDTILGETHDAQETFLTDNCDNAPLGSILAKVGVDYRPPAEDWAMSGGKEVEKGEEGYYYKMWYDSVKARFETPPEEYQSWAPTMEVPSCPCCVRLKAVQTSLVPTYDANSGVLRYQHSEYRVGDFAYIKPDAYTFPIKQTAQAAIKHSVKKETVDEEMFPEYYRKTDYVKGSNDKVPFPYKIGKITELKVKASTLDGSVVSVTVEKLYRPENTHKGITSSYGMDLNCLYYSEEKATFQAVELQGKCCVKYIDDIKSLDEYNKKQDCFYYTQAYDSKAKEFVDVPDSAKKGLGKGKGKKKSAEQEPKDSQTFRKLRTLDVFAGCGGLSEGFHQAGVAESKWAIEFVPEAAKAYKLNNPNATVFNEDCNAVLKMALEGQLTNSLGQLIPKKGEVELLCGGPPCQGFSGMNRFNAREYSMFKNSLISSYLSYCEFYRPRYFLLENVRNFVSYKKNMVLKLCLSSLVRMGYQCTFGVLQAGCYGVAQTRRRAFIIACAPGEILPQYPEPQHVFSPNAMQLKVVIEGQQYKSHITRWDSAPLRNITVRDTMSDLPCIVNGASKKEMAYDKEPGSWFQRKIRNNTEVLTDHVCKEMNSLVAMRMRNIPLAPGSDWRDLPNISLKLPDNKPVPKLVYTHNDKKNGKGGEGALRGVCCCATGAKCDTMDRQHSTLIPWCLPHTGNRHNHWAGLYGRVNWDGFFSTTITNPEPMGKQGRVLHPEQHRVVSVRECARSQGFPDNYKFCGTVLDKHRQVGNAVPPPMAKAIGTEIKKSLTSTKKR